MYKYKTYGFTIESYFEIDFLQPFNTNKACEIIIERNQDLVTPKFIKNKETYSGGDISNFYIFKKKAVLIKISNGKKIEIKHGCTEYYEKHPNFKKINYNGEQEMSYDKSWQKHEKFVDDNSPPVSERVINPTMNKINLSDLLIIKNWLNYAELIGDTSFRGIYNSDYNSDFLKEKLKDQLSYRKHQ